MRDYMLLVNLFDEGAPGASTNIQDGGSDIALEVTDQDAVYEEFLIRCQFANDTTLKGIVNRVGDNPQTTLAKEGNDLIGGSAYMLRVQVFHGETWNFQIGTDGAIAFMQIARALAGGN